VAGATGKGKSVGLNAIITSLLYKKGPSELKFVLVDPKRVEFSVYADLDPYFFAKVPGEDRAIVTETARVVHTLNCLVQEMENRYRVLEDVKVRKVEDYNDKWRSELRELRDEHGEPRYQYMPYIVAIIDEFSDMIMTAGKEVETPIVRIAQKARAVGIHMIIATQRPSSTVITGLIKSNFPGRVAFAVSSMVDSRIIIDMSGAQRLIGRGDMLFMVDGEITRLQCPFVDTPDIVKIVEFIRKQEDDDRDVDHQEAFMLPEYVAGDEGGSGGEASTANLKERDPLFEEAVRWIVQSDTASTSSLQRRYEIGYNRAGRIMDQMEAAGIVGPSQGGKPRKVLVDPLQVEQILGN
jgi:S-DNA-T family DNA segregation ATPase FtsK/SpoIIIE